MFPTLIESARKTNKQRVLSGSCVSLVVHAGVIAGAVYGTLAAAASDRAVKVDTAVVVLAPQQQPKPPAQQPAQLDAPLQGFQPLVVPPQIPADLPAVDLAERCGRSCVCCSTTPCRSTENVAEVSVLNRCAYAMSRR